MSLNFVITGLLYASSYGFRRRIVCKCSIAIVRGVPDSFASGLLAPGIKEESIDLGKARQQHAAYVSFLRRNAHVERLIELPALHDLPDSVFVEDSACFLARNHFLVPSSAAPSRAAEARHMANDLNAHGFSTVLSALPFDGGDVLRVGNNYVFVGTSSRTDERAIAQLSKIAPNDQRQVYCIAVPSSLHLKTIVTWINTRSASCISSSKPEGFFVAPDTDEGREVVGQLTKVLLGPTENSDKYICWLQEKDAYAANTMQIGSVPGTVMMAKGYNDASSAVRDKLNAWGANAVVLQELDMSEFRKANGALTCLSIVI